MKHIGLITALFFLQITTARAELNGLLNDALNTADTIQKTTETVNAVNQVVENDEEGLSDFISSMVKELGVTKTQARGGTGALFNLAKSRMAPTEFTQVSQSIPGMEGLLAAAPKANASSSGLLQGISAIAGESSGVADAASLVNAFNQLDLSQGMIPNFTNAIVKYVKKSSGDLVGNLLQSALSGS